MTPDNPQYVVIMTTCANEEQATHLASTLVEKRLAACVQTHPIHSTYRWNDALESAAEISVSIKARASHYPAIQAWILANHAYTNPEIIALPVIAGSSAYLEWIDTETR